MQSPAESRVHFGLQATVEAEAFGEITGSLMRIDGVGISRLPALNGRGIAAVTVDCWTARIGDAGSTLKTGVLSHVNRTAEAQGAQRGSTLHSWLEMVQEIPLINAL